MEIVVLIIVIAFCVIFLSSFFVSLQKETAKAKRCTATPVETFSDVPIQQKHRAAISFAVKVKKKQPSRNLRRAS
jgi:hypothetical protein